MAKQDEWARITLRLPADLHGKLTESAGEKSLNAEIVARLEDSYVDMDSSVEDLSALTEAALASLEENAEDARRELQEYRVMTSQIRLMRHLLTRIIIEGGAQLPPHLSTMVDLLGVTQVSELQGGDALSIELLEKSMAAMVDLEKIEGEQETPAAKAARADRQKRMDKAREIAARRGLKSS